MACKNDLNNWPSYPAGVLAAQIAGVSNMARAISGLKRANYRVESESNTYSVMANRTPQSGALGAINSGEPYYGSPQVTDLSSLNALNTINPATGKK
jgi:hypothetical protein